MLEKSATSKWVEPIAYVSLGLVMLHPSYMPQSLVVDRLQKTLHRYCANVREEHV